MDSSSAQQQQHHHQQEMGLESMVVCKDNKKARPADMQALKCPRCDSSNTKFCYYNNYSLSQPRYFCKSCRRYWTKGGTLRNVPVGGGCRKNKRSSSSKPLPSMAPPTSDLNLAIARLQKQNPGHLGLEDRDVSMWGHADLLGTSSGLFDAIRSGVFDNHSGGGNGMHNLYYGMGNMEAGHEMGMPSSYGGDADGKILWGFPWQNMNTAGDANGSDFDSARLNWSGIASSNWQGLLNSPLT